jgi:hypothetical protein
MPQPAPDWVSFNADKTEGLDLLGLRAPVQRIGNDLFNGVTTVTPKIRYMSVLVWIIWRYSQARLPDARTPFLRFAEAQEAVIVMANRVRNRAILNLVGVTKADELLDTRRRRLPLPRLAQNIAFNIYVNSSLQLNLTHQTPKNFPGLTEDRGLALARAFDGIIRDSAYGEDLTRRPSLDSVSRQKLEELAESLSLERIPRDERNILIDAIMPVKPVDDAERNRLANYSLLLWLTQNNEAGVGESDVFAAAREVPRGLPDCLHAILDSWLEYIIRDVLAVTHEAVFGAVLRQIDVASAARGGPALAADVVATLLDDADEHNGILRKCGLLRQNESVSAMRFSQLQERVHRACQEHETTSRGLRRWRGGLSETEVYSMSLESGMAAAVFLPVAWCLAAERISPALREAAPVDSRILSIGSFYQIGLADVILPKIDEFIREDRSVQDVMAELITRTVQQHLRVAWTRFSPPQGRDVSVIVADMDTWSRNNRFTAGRTDSRLSVAISWLWQLGLTSDEGLTAAGERVLDRSLQALDGGQRG